MYSQPCHFELNGAEIKLRVIKYLKIFIGKMCIINHGWNFQPLQHIQIIQFDFQNKEVKLRIGI